MTYKVYGYIKTKLNYPMMQGTAYMEKLNRNLTEELEYTLDSYKHYRVSCVPILQNVRVPRGKAEKFGQPLDIEVPDNLVDMEFTFSMVVGHVFNFVIDDVYYLNTPTKIGDLIFNAFKNHTIENFEDSGADGEVAFFSIVEWGCTIETLNEVYVYKNGKPLTVSVPEPKQELEFPSYTKFTTERPKYGAIVNLIVVAPDGSMAEYNDYYYFKDRLFIPLEDGENIRVDDESTIFWQTSETDEQAETDDKAEDGMGDLVDEICNC